MSTRLRILRAIVVNIGFITIALYSIWEGGDPTVVGALGISMLGLYNGVEIADAAALAQALAESRENAEE